MEEPGKYHTSPTPWVIVRWHSLTQRTVVRRFRSRNDADGHLAVLRRLMPNADLRVVFDLDHSSSKI